MQGGSTAFAGRTAHGGAVRLISSVALLLSALALSACVNAGQIANLTEGSHATVAFETITGPVPKFPKNL
jgi:hypothetical protein